MPANSVDIWWTFVIATSVLVLLSVTLVRTIALAHRRYVKIQTLRSQELSENEERFRLLVERSSDALILLTPTGELKYASPNTEEVIGIDLHHTPFDMLLKELHPGDRGTLDDLTSRVLVSPGKTFSAQFRVRNGSGSWKHFEIVGTNFLDEPSVKAIAVNCRDITTRKQAEEDLKRLTNRVIEVQESEGKRVASELHDGIGQMLHSAKLLVDSAELKSAPKRGKGFNNLHEASKMLGKSIRELRRIVQNLRPVALDELGLLPAVRGLCDEFKSRSGMSVQLKVETVVPQMNSEVELALYRIVQECLSNIEKHSRAKRVAVEFTRDEALLRIVIRDNGIGFIPSERSQILENTHLGLIHMKERASHIGGELRIQSVLRQGTEVVVHLPISKTPPR